MRATVIIDASFCPNTRAAGWAAWVRFDDGRLLKKYDELRERVKTPQEAELMATANGIFLAVMGGATDLLVQTDCLDVVKILEGRYPKYAGRTLQRRWGQVKPLLVGAMRSPMPRIEARHVKGHTSREGARYYVNNWCDRHAKHGMRAQRKTRR